MGNRIEVRIENGKVMAGETVIQYMPYGKITGWWVVNRLCRGKFDAYVSTSQDKGPEFDWDEVFGVLPQGMERRPLKDIYKDCGDYLGVSCAVMAKLLNGAIYRNYIKGKEPLIARWAQFGKKMVDGGIVEMITKNYSAIKTYEADGLVNLMGVAMATGLPTDQMKKMVGPAVWKSLHANSKSRNDLIAKKALSVSYRLDPPKTGPVTAYPEHIIAEVPPERIAEMIAELNSAPTTLLMKMKREVVRNAYRVGYEWRMCNSLIPKLVKEVKGPLKNVAIKEIEDTLMHVQDTNNLAGALRMQVNKDWSLKRFRDEHSRLTRLMNERTIKKLEQTCSSGPIGWLHALPKTVEKDGFKAVRLDSQKDIAVCGVEQSHCVGSYARHVANGDYVVYKIVGPTCEVSTIGWGPDMPCQHKLYRNGECDFDTEAFGMYVKAEVDKVWRTLPKPERPQLPVAEVFPQLPVAEVLPQVPAVPQFFAPERHDEDRYEGDVPCGDLHF
jgi:hypothetical protein